MTEHQKQCANKNMQNVEKRVPSVKTHAVGLTALKQNCTIFKGSEQTDPSRTESVRNRLSTADVTTITLWGGIIAYTKT